ncbi:MAG: histidinol dehydrogenase [Pseudomonadota bacterium]
MAHLLDTADPDFAAAFDRLLGLRETAQPAVDQVVSGILADVRARGIAPVLELTEKFDRLALTPETVALSEDDIAAEIAKVPDAERAALEQAADRIRAYHERQLPEDASWTDETGTRLGWRWTPVDRAGLYVPGGLASYPSSVLMNAIPAQVAGVRDLVICAPTPDGELNPLVVLAAQLGGVSRIFRVGGAQAVAAMAYGADQIPAVDVITGPGNAYVAEAKRQVFGRVGIDMIAGPSEVLIIAEKDNDPDWIALDLMAQAEHDADAQSVLITDDAGFARAVAAAVDARLETLERTSIAGASWRDFGAIITVADMAEAPALANRIAPEHLEIMCADPDALMAEIRHAGAIFLGQYTPEAIGDYVGGPNHVLPTAGSARFSSGLSVLDFMKRTTVSAVSPEAMKAVGPAAATLARSESLEAHALSVERRLEVLN